jgi:uncharacterized protein YggE
MKLAYMVLPAVALLLVPAAVSAQSIGLLGPQPATLSVSGDGLIQRSPDIARVSVQIVTSDDDATVSAGKNTAIYNALKAKLAPLDLASDALTTTYFNVNFIPHPPKGLPPEQLQPRYGYVTTRAVTITVAPLENAGKAVDAANAAGATETANVSFDLKDRKAAYREALTAAMEDAKRNAAALSTGGGFTLVKFRNISANSGGVQPYQAPVMRAMSVAAAPQPPTELGNGAPISISAHVSVTYEIK